MPEGIENLKYMFRGVKAVILVEDKEVVVSEFDDMKTKRLSTLVYLLLAACKEKSTFKRVIIETENEKFYVFYRKDFFLGALCDAEINFPLLKHLVKKALKFVEAQRVEGGKPEEKRASNVEDRAKSFL